MKTGIIVQARMSSSRLPGKVLRQSHGKAVLEYLLERLALCKSGAQVIIATSDDASDKPVEDFCVANKVPCFRGPLQDVAKRFLEAARKYKLEAFVRISADSPVMDPALVDNLISEFEKGEYDLVTNTFPRSFPKGQSIEVVRTASFERAYPQMSEPGDFEHVTQLFYRKPEGWKIKNVPSGGDYAAVNLCVDTMDDFELFDAMVERMDRPFADYRWPDMVRLREQTLMEKK